MKHINVLYIYTNTARFHLTLLENITLYGQIEIFRPSNIIDLPLMTGGKFYNQINFGARLLIKQCSMVGKVSR
jgi:hypothetical protein